MLNSDVIMNDGRSLENSDEGTMFFSPMPVSSSATCELPSMEEFAGEYDFHMRIGNMEREVKRNPWQYSDKLNKVFIIGGRSLPMQFRIVSCNPRGLYIRAVAIYCDPNAATIPVLRCPNHLQALQDPINENYHHLDHVVSCSHASAVYEEDHISHRRSVCVPLFGPQAGTDTETIMFALMCFSSCTNGINRRPLALVFTLEKEYKVVGRRMLRVRVCASPYRDRMNEERKSLEREEKANGVNGNAEEDQKPVINSDVPEELGVLEETHFVPVMHRDDAVALIKLAKELVQKDFPEGLEKQQEIDQYNKVLRNYNDIIDE